MKPKCEQIRERAFRDGLDSPAAAEWRAHCRSCPDCRTEIFILENLERQAADERQHLGREEVAKLLEMARRHTGRRRSSVFVWGMRAACFLALLVVAAGLLPGEQAARVRRGVESWLRGEEFPVGTLAEITERVRNRPTEGAIVPAGTVAPEVLVPAASVQNDMRKLRRSVDDRRRSLRQLLERDFGPFGPEGAWHVTFQPIPDRA